MTKDVYYLVKVNMEGQDELRLIFGPQYLQFREDSRTFDEMERSAVDKGFELQFCTSYYGVGPKRSRDIRKTCVEHVRRKGWQFIDEYDVSVDICCRATKYYGLQTD